MTQTAASKLEAFREIVHIESFYERYAQDVQNELFFGYPIAPALEAERQLLAPRTRSIAYFSMEFGLSSSGYNAFQSVRPVSEKNLAPSHRVFSNLRSIDYYVSVDLGKRLDLPIYSGGLGVLAGDTLKSAADRGLSLAGVGILWNKGYFKQNFWFKDGQIPEENVWDPWSYPGLLPLVTRVVVPLRRENITLRLWKYFVYSHDRRHVVPLVLLDSNLEENSPFTRRLTDSLYKSDNAEWKILQRIVLGIGGMKALEALGYKIDVHHLNEGHAALAFVEQAKKMPAGEIESLKDHFAYTCHTPVAAGHDRLPRKIVQEILKDEEGALIRKFGQDPDNSDLVNLTVLAMNTCRNVNAVAQKHGEVTRAQFPDYRDRIRSITNGVHAHTWVSEPFAALFDQYAGAIGQWRRDPSLLRQVSSLLDDHGFRRGLWEAHQANKTELCRIFKSWRIRPEVFTICWARRIAAYKRPSLILQDVERLLTIARRVGPMQVIFAGKAHPKDDIGFTNVNEMLSIIDSLESSRDVLRVMMLENYDTAFGKLLSSGVDVWLNNPLPPFEASGTSGMKAILNGVLQLSTLDGWVVEAADKDIGWIFGWKHSGEEIGDERNLRLAEDAGQLYDTLERVVALYYETRRPEGPALDSAWISKMIRCVEQAGFFNTDRMVREYQEKIWQVTGQA